MCVRCIMVKICRLHIARVLQKYLNSFLQISIIYMRHANHIHLYVFEKKIFQIEKYVKLSQKIFKPVTDGKAPKKKKGIPTYPIKCFFFKISLHVDFANFGLRPFFQIEVRAIKNLECASHCEFYKIRFFPLILFQKFLFPH